MAFHLASQKAIELLPPVCFSPQPIIASGPDTFIVNWDTVSITFPVKLLHSVPSLPHTIDLIEKDSHSDFPIVKAPVLLSPLPPPPPPPPATKISCGGVWMSERMPVFPGCDESLPYEERKACGERKLMDFVYANIRYPATARNWNCTGTAIIEFVVRKNGLIDEVEIVADPGCSLGAIALEAVTKMSQQGIVWIPGRQGGRNVAVRFSLPVRFKLD